MRNIFFPHYLSGEPDIAVSAKLHYISGLEYSAI